MQPKKIIIVEDDKMLSTVFRMFLNQIGHELIGFYTSAEEAIKKIEEDKPDIVLMDILLPDQMNGIIAADIIKEKYNIPTIYISSSTDTETLKNALKTNPYGYLIKPIDKYSLQIAIEIALQKFEKEQEFERAENAILNLPFYAFIVDCNGEIIWKNKKCNILKEEKLEDIISKYNTDFYKNIILKAIKLDGKFEDETDIIINLKKQKYNVVSYLIKNNKDCNEVLFLISDIVKDKSDDAKISCNEEYKILKNSINEALFFFDSKNKLIDYNELAVKYSDKLLNVELNSNIDVFTLFNFIDKRDLKSLVQNIFDGISHYMERSANIDEKDMFFKISMFPFELDDKVVKYCVSLNDITWIKKIEEELNDTKENLKPIFQSSIQRFYLLNLEYELVAFNNKAFEVIQREYRHNLKKGDNILNFVPKEIGVDKFKEYFEQAKLGENISFKIKYIDDNGDVRWNESHLDPVINEKGEIYRILLWTIDITDSEQNILELEESQKRYELVANGGNDGIWDWDIVNNEIYLSPRWKAVLGYDDESLENKFGVRDSLIHPDDYIRSREILEDYLQGKTDIYENEVRFRHKNGEYRWILERGMALRDEYGKPLRLAGSITDITERKEMLNKISIANKQLMEERDLFNKGDVVVMRAEKTRNTDKLKITYCSENSKLVLGYDSNEFIEGKVDFEKIIHPDDYLMHKNERDIFVKSGNKHVKFSDYRIITPDKSIRWVRDFTTILTTDESDKIEFLGYYFDVTKYKKLEQELEESRKKYSLLFEKANDAILIIKNNKIVESNIAAREFFGYSDDEFKTLDINNLSSLKQPSGSSSEEKFERKVNEAIEGSIEPYYWQYKNKQGELVDTEVTLTVININDEQLLHVVIRDITLRKQMERSLKESQEKLESLYNAIPDMIIILDKDGNYVDYKPDAERRLAVEPTTLIGKKLTDFFDEEKTKEILENLHNVIKTGTIYKYTYEMDSQLGWRKFEARMSKVNEFLVLSIIRDITEA